MSPEREKPQWDGGGFDDCEGDEETGPLMTVESVSKRFRTPAGDVPVIDEASFGLVPGRLLALMGPSGSGKTTLLNMIAGLERPTGGDIFFRNRNLSHLSDRALTRLRRNSFGLIFQSSVLMPFLTAEENVELALRLRERRDSSWPGRVREALNAVGVRQRSDHMPSELSGGERQRIAIAQALVTGPEIILADEPTAEVDSLTGLKILKLFKEIALSKKAAVCLGSHDPSLLEVADDVFRIRERTLVRSV